MRRALSIILCFFVVASFFPFDVKASDLICISNFSDLDNIRYNLNGHYVLTNNIDMSACDNWTPIGTDSTPFTGILDGNGFEIRNLKVSQLLSIPKGNTPLNAGLFSTISGAKILNLGIVNASIYYKLDGGNSSDYAFCHAGGFTGWGHNSEIERCYFIGSVLAEGINRTYVRSSAFGGFGADSAIVNSYSNAFISAKGENANTMVGGITSWNSNTKVEKCYAAGSLYAENTNSYVYCGGISGSGGDGSISNCVALQNSTTFGNCYRKCTDTICAYANLSNNKATSNLTNSLGNKSAILINESATKQQSTYESLGWDFNDIWKFDDYPILRNTGKPDFEIISHPANVIAKVGDSVSFTVKAQGEGLKYQWYYKKSDQTAWNKWGTRTTSTTTATANSTWDGMKVYCKVTDKYGNYLNSKTVIITITGLKMITQPTNKTINLGSSVTLSLKAEGSGLTYQWYYKKAGQTSFSTWNGRTHASETVTPNITWNGIQLYCIVKDSGGNKVQSNTITVTVKANVDGKKTFRAMILNGAQGGLNESCDNDAAMMYARSCDNELSDAIVNQSNIHPFNYDCDGSTTSVADVNKLIDYSFKGTDDDDISLFYYTGHSTWDGNSAENYGITLGTGYYRWSQLSSYLSQKIKGNIVVIMDSCFSGHFINTGLTGLSEFDRSRFTIITSCSDGEESSVKKKNFIFHNAIYYGCFSYYLGEGIGFFDEQLKADANKDKKITVDELYAYVNNKVVDKTKNSTYKMHVQLYTNQGSMTLFEYRTGKSILKKNQSISCQDSIIKYSTDKPFSLQATAKTSLSYKSLNTQIATVDSSGKVKINSSGTVKIQITAKATKQYNPANKTVTISVLRPLKITTQPVNKSIKVGSSLTLSLKADGTSLKYQWYFKKKGQTSFNIWNGRTHSTETVSPNSTWDGIQLYCKITDGSGKTLNSSTVTINVLSITTQPSNVTVAAGSNATFKVVATGSGLKYQWQYKKSGQTSWNNWGARTTASTTATSNATWNGMQVRCIVTDSAGNKITSNPATITIK